MKKEIIFTEKATKPTAPYSQAVKVGNIVYLAGACRDLRNTDQIVGDGDIKIEAKYALENIKPAVEEAAGTMENVVKMNVFVKDIKMMKDFNEVYSTYFPVDPPARIAMQITDLAGGANLEIDGVAIL